MKATFTLLIVIVIAVGMAACTQKPEHAAHNDDAHKTSAPSSMAEQTKPVPAHYEKEPPRISLQATLEPEKFTGKTKEAYRIVHEAPQLIAQLPCYCYCDRGFGHKSLHSCYVDDHAAHCAVCVDEVLKAYDLHKRGMPAQQIREQIVAQFGS